MRLEERPINSASGTILMHNIADAEGKRILRKGILLDQEHLSLLAGLGRSTVLVAVLEGNDVHEDAAAQMLASALQTERLHLSRPAGGRVNLRSLVDGLLRVDAERLLAFNMLPGITLATRRQHAVVGPNQGTDNVGTLKIIPYAVRRQDVDQALKLASTQPGFLDVRAFPSDRQAAMLLVGDPSVHNKLQAAFEPPTRTRLERLGAVLGTVEGVPQDESAIARAAGRLVAEFDLLIIAGQTSIIHEEDTTLRALRQAGAQTTLSGAPVEPGNLLALAHFPGTPVMCAPGCARGLKYNVVDLVLPRLLLGDRLERRDIAELGLGGFLTKVERAGEI